MLTDLMGGLDVKDGIFRYSFFRAIVNKVSSILLKTFFANSKNSDVPVEIRLDFRLVKWAAKSTGRPKSLLAFNTDISLDI